MHALYGVLRRCEYLNTCLTNVGKLQQVSSSVRSERVIRYSFAFPFCIPFKSVTSVLELRFVPINEAGFYQLSKIDEQAPSYRLY